MSLVTVMQYNTELRESVLDTDYLLLSGSDNTTEQILTEFDDNEVLRVSSMVLLSILLSKEARIPYSTIADKVPQISFSNKQDDTVSKIVKSGIILADRFCKGDNSILPRMIGFSVYVGSIVCIGAEYDKDKTIEVLTSWSKLAYSNIVEKIVSPGSVIKYNPYFGEPTKILKGMDVDLRIDNTIYNILFESSNDLCNSVLIGAYHINQTKHNKYKLRLSDVGIINLMNIRVDKISISTDEKVIDKLEKYLDMLVSGA